MAENKKVWCVESTDGWCACKENKEPQEGTTKVRTLCDMNVAMPFAFAKRLPDCKDCLAILNPAPKEDKGVIFTTRVGLLPHGYQIDTFDEKAKLIGSECRDFGGNYPTEKMQNVILGGFLHVLNKAEFYYKRNNRFTGMSENDAEVALERTQTIRRAILFVIVNNDKNPLARSEKSLSTYVRGIIKADGYPINLPTKAEVTEEAMMLVGLGVVLHEDGHYYI